MANVKNGALREIIIDRCLHSRRGYSTKEMMDKCNEALEARMFPPVTSTNTIRNDIDSIKSRWRVRVDLVKEGQCKRYRYRDPGFSIYNSPFNEEEISQLTQTTNMLSRFEGMPGFEWVDELNVHLQNTLNTNAAPIVSFDENKLLKGMQHFTPLFKLISNKQVAVVTYRPYKSDRIIKDTIHPYHLKQYNRRWFLFGLNEFNGKISNFALDRIVSIEKSDKKYIQNKDIDFDEYFKNIIGVSLMTDPIEDIKIHVQKSHLPYVLSKPIHPSQNVIEEQEDGSAIISINVIPNYELYQTLLSHGSGITVLSPAHVRDEIKTKIQENLGNYE